MGRGENVDNTQFNCYDDFMQHYTDSAAFVVTNESAILRNMQCFRNNNTIFGMHGKACNPHRVFLDKGCSDSCGVQSGHVVFSERDTSFRKYKNGSQ